MEWAAWAPTVAAIRAEFGYQETDDLAAARDLQALVGAASRFRDLGADLRNRRNIVVAGCGPSLEQAPPSLFVGKITVAADGATQRLQELGVVPNVVVTDLDGDPKALEWAAQAGARMVVHAHGDNRPALRTLVPRLGPILYGTHQVEPNAGLKPLENPGGFTDGDRAVLLCEEFGARQATLVGFDFDASPGPYSHRWDPQTKPAKLAWARRIIDAAHQRGRMVIQHWVP